MDHSSNRREVLRELLVASLGGILPSSKLYGNDAQQSKPVREQHDFEPMRHRIRQEIAQGTATGVAVAVAHRGRIVWEEGFGWANLESGVKATPHTPFCLASITKPFTTTLLMTLVSENKVSLGEPGNKYLESSSRIVGPNGNPEDATVRLLGAHASGLPGMFSGYCHNGPAQAPTPARLLRDYGRLAYAPGSVYEYCNIGFVALGAIASNVTGMNFGTLMQRRVLTPLGMYDSFFSNDIARLSTSAVGYDASAKPIPYYTTSTPPSGEIYVSAHDLARFSIFNLKNRFTGQARFLDDRWIEELHKPVFVGALGVASTFGWFTAHLKSGAPYLFKGGGQPGVATKLYLVPSENLACLVLTNRTDGTKLANGLCDQILASYLPEWTPPKEFVLSENAGFSHSPFVATRDFLGRWEGTLKNGGADMRISLQINSSSEASFGLGEKPAQQISDMQSEGPGLTGTSAGLIESADAREYGIRKLVLKLVPQEGKLVGRIIARGVKPGLVLANLPYVLTLSRVSG
jgi:CubicO group peptidase (beta-lactamase class C family)